MKMLKILLRAMIKKQACAHEMCWHGPLMSESAFQMLIHHCPRVDLLHLIIGALREHVVLPPFCLTRVHKADAHRTKKFRLPPWIKIGGDKRYDVARLSTGAPGSQPTLWNWPPRNICQTRLLVLTSSADTGAAFRSPAKRKCVVVYVCMCLCAPR